MTLYIDTDYRLHTEPAPGLRAVELPEMEGKCRAYIEGYRYVPEGQTWTREDGEVFAGAMLSPARDYSTLAELQAVAEDEQAKAAADMAALVEDVYRKDMEAIANV